MGVGAGLYMCDVVKKLRSLSQLLMSSCSSFIVLFVIVLPVMVTRIHNLIDCEQRNVIGLRLHCNAFGHTRKGPCMYQPLSYKTKKQLRLSTDVFVR